MIESLLHQFEDEYDETAILRQAIENKDILKSCFISSTIIINEKIISNNLIDKREILYELAFDNHATREVFNSKGIDHFYTLQCKGSNDLSIEKKSQIYSILKDNMKDLYEENKWGWNDSEKKNEIFSLNSRFLIIGDELLNDTVCDTSDVSCINNNNNTNNEKNTTMMNKINAYIIFKFEWDDDDEPEYPVLYCYELQVLKAFQQKGAGEMLMNILKNIANHFKMWKIILTCFKNNITAMNFYKKTGFSIDSSSPSNYGNQKECYEILSNKSNVVK